MANRTQLEDCRRSRKLDAEYNRTVISNLSAENAMLREALRCVESVYSCKAGQHINDECPHCIARAALAKGGA